MTDPRDSHPGPNVNRDTNRVIDVVSASGNL